MSDFVSYPGRSTESRPSRPEAAAYSPALPLVGQYLSALAMVAGATVVALIVKHSIAAPNLTLIYVLPVVVAGVAFGWGPSLAAVIAGVLAFDFFFTEPYYSFTIDSPADIWAAAMLLVVATIVTTVAAGSRRRALEARRAAEQAEALQDLAHVVIQARPRAEVLQAAARTLHGVFRAPAVIFLPEHGHLGRAASAGGPELSRADEEAARGALSAHLHTRAETYPYDKAKFDFWPIETPSAGGCVIGVDFTRADGGRPDKPDRYVDLISGYLAVALAARK
jgi:two-component system sensor histidine kinase KdpD